MHWIVTALIDLAARVAKAIVRRLAKWTLTRLVRWMRKKVRDFKDRWNRARIEGDERRMRWNLGRSERWTKAADWLEENALEKLRDAAERVCRLPAFQKLPEVARCELLSSH
jgi:hypothetical protein